MDKKARYDFRFKIGDMTGIIKASSQWKAKQVVRLRHRGVKLSDIKVERTVIKDGHYNDMATLYGF